MVESDSTLETDPRYVWSSEQVTALHEQVSAFYAENPGLLERQTVWYLYNISIGNPYLRNDDGSIRPYTEWYREVDPPQDEVDWMSLKLSE